MQMIPAGKTQLAKTDDGCFDCLGVRESSDTPVRCDTTTVFTFAACPCCHAMGRMSQALGDLAQVLGVQVAQCILKCSHCPWVWTEARHNNYSTQHASKQYARIMKDLGCFNVDLDTAIQMKREELAKLHPHDIEAIHQFCALREDAAQVPRCACTICGRLDNPAYYVVCCWDYVCTNRACLARHREFCTKYNDRFDLPYETIPCMLCGIEDISTFDLKNHPCIRDHCHVVFRLLDTVQTMFAQGSGILLSKS